MQAAFFIQEYLCIIDDVVSALSAEGVCRRLLTTPIGFDESFDKTTNTTTITPGDVWKDLGSGFLYEAGVSAVFFVTNQSLLTNAVPKIGVEISPLNVVGKVNVPARRRLMTVDDAIVATVANPVASVEPVTMPRKLQSTLTPGAFAALYEAGIFTAFASLLPPSLQANLTRLLTENAVPFAKYLSMNNLTLDQIIELRKELGLEDSRLTVQLPQLPNPLATTVIPCLDVELSFTLLAQPNQVGTNLRVTPFATRFLGQQVFQSIKVAPFASAFISSTAQQTALLGASLLNATSGVLHGDASAARAFF